MPISPPRDWPKPQSHTYRWSWRRFGFICADCRQRHCPQADEHRLAEDLAVWWD